MCYKSYSNLCPSGKGKKPFLFLFLVGLRVRAVHIGLLRHARFAILGLIGPVEAFIPEQGAAIPLLGFQRGLAGLELVDEKTDLRVVIGAAKDGHGVD